MFEMQRAQRKTQVGVPPVWQSAVIQIPSPKRGAEKKLGLAPSARSVRGSAGSTWWNARSERVLGVDSEL